MEGAVEDLPRCSAPRLLEETFRLIRGGHAAPAMRLLRALDALKMLLPPVDAYLRERDQAATDGYFKFVSVMDELINSDVAFDDSMLLASILLPLALEEPEVPAGQEDTGQPVVSVARAVESLLHELFGPLAAPHRRAVPNDSDGAAHDGWPSPTSRRLGRLSRSPVVPRVAQSVRSLGASDQRRPRGA